MRLGVFGGTFNPIHLGHLRAAEEVREALALDRVVFVPARLPPHKASDGLADADYRLNLVRLAVADNPGFSVSDLELRRDGPSWSIDTLEALLREERPQELKFIMGADQYAELHTWRRFTDIIALVDIVVMTRPPDFSPIAPPKGAEKEYVAIPGGWRHRSGRVVRHVAVTPIAISSTLVREALKNGKSARYLVPESIRTLVEAHSAQKGTND